MFGDAASYDTQTEHSNRESREIELHGILYKKNGKGFFQSRYFRTAGALLSYYKDKESFIRNALVPSASYKFVDMKSVAIISDCRFMISFDIASLELELKALSESQAIHWVSFIKAKINLYAVNMVIFYYCYYQFIFMFIAILILLISVAVS